jgi:hypothetical protein
VRFKNRALGQGKKYNNRKCEADGFKFDSLKERQRYYELKALQSTGKITELEVHPTYLLSMGEIVVRIKGDKKVTRARYIADFSYCLENKQRIVEDVKSTFMAKDKYFRLKRAIFEALYNLEVTVVL